jgi:hypothetical protein
LHQVTVTPSAPAARNTRPDPVVGSRSAKKGETRGGPARKRVTERSVLAKSASPNVMLPSELMNALDCAPP